MELTKNFLSCFDDKIHIINNGYDELALGYCLWDLTGKETLK